MIKKVLSLLLVFLLLALPGCKPADTSGAEPEISEDSVKEEASKEPEAQPEASSEEESPAEEEESQEEESLIQVSESSVPVQPRVESSAPPQDPEAQSGQESQDQVSGQEPEGQGSSEAETDPDALPGPQAQQGIQAAAGDVPVQTAVAEQSSYSVASETIKVIITNESQVEGSYSLAYRIQRLTDNEWQTLPLEFLVLDIAMILEPGQSSTVTVNLYQDQYAYTPGQYRVVFSSWDMTAEFTLV